MAPTFVFAGEPMCSWCYGFAKELDQALAALPGLKLEIRVAGLWAGGRQPLDDAAKRMRLGHWARVETAAGVPFNREAFMAHQGMVYDTEPIARAFVAGLRLAPGLRALDLFRALQRAFYVDGLDTTSDATLAQVLAQELARQGHAESAAFAATALADPAVQTRTRQHFQWVRAHGLTHFPQLLRVDGERARVLLDGFEKAEVIGATLRAELG